MLQLKGLGTPVGHMVGMMYAREGHKGGDRDTSVMGFPPKKWLPRSHPTTQEALELPDEQWQWHFELAHLLAMY